MRKCAVVKDKALGISTQCRCDTKYLSFVSRDCWSAFGQGERLSPLSELLTPLPASKRPKGDLETSCLLVNISDQEPGGGMLDWDRIAAVDEINSDKTVLSDGDLIVSKLGMPKGYIYLLPETERELIGSTEFIPYALRKPDMNYLILYLLLTPEMRNAYACLETGKTPSHKRVNPEEFLKIQVPRFREGADTGRLNERIRKRVLEIEALLGRRERIQEKLEAVFAQRFQYDMALPARFGKGVSQPTQSLPPRGRRSTSLAYGALARSPALRMSVRFHNEITQALAEVLRGIPTVKLGSLVLTPVHRGCSPRYKAEGEIPVVKTAHLRDGRVAVSEEEFVSACDYERDERAQVQDGDLLIASTGKGSIGKAAVAWSGERLYADSHITIIRLDRERYNPEFALCFLQSVLGYFQIERDYTGCTNQVDIYPDSIAELLVPDLTLEEQERIVGKVRAELDRQDSIQAEIARLRGEIDAIVREAVF